MRAGILVVLAAVTAFSVLPEDSARIYVYAQRLTAARSWLRISCDAAVVARLKQGRFFAVELAPGRHMLSCENGLPLLVEVRAGAEFFVRLDWRYRADGPAVPVLSAVRPAQASREMRYLSYIEPSKALAPSVPKADPRAPARPQLKTR